MTARELMTKVVGKMRNLQKEMDELLGKADAVQGDERTKLLDSFNSKQGEYKEFSAEAKTLKGLVQQEEELVAFESMANTPDDGDVNLAPDINGKSGAKPQGKQSSITVDESAEADDRLRRDMFLRFVQDGYGGLSGNEAKALQPKDMGRFKNVAAKSMVATLPKSMARNIMAQGKNVPVPDYMRGKVVLSTDATGGSTDSGAANLLLPDYRPDLQSMPVSPITLYDYVQLVQAQNGSVEWPVLDQDQGDFGGVAFTWKATEGADKGETEPVFKDFEVGTHELSGWTELSNTAMRRSALDLESTLTMLFRNAAKHEWSRVILIGAGDSANQPQGVLASGIITQGPAREAAAAVSYVDLVGCEFAVRKALRAGARFVIGDDVEKHLASQVDADERPLFRPDVHNPQEKRLIGYGYETHEFDEPDLGDTGDVVFGNFQNYTFAVEEDIAIARSDHAEFKKGRVVFRLMCFVGGKVRFAKAFSRLPAYA